MSKWHIFILQKVSKWHANTIEKVQKWRVIIYCVNKNPTGNLSSG